MTKLSAGLPLLLLSLPLSSPTTPTSTTNPLTALTTLTTSATECKALSLACTSSHPGSKEHCLLDSIKEHRTGFLANIIIIMVVGFLGNLLTLAALPYAWLYHSARFPTLPSSTTVLLLHLSLCDVLYCLLGLSVQVSILVNGYFK